MIFNEDNILYFVDNEKLDKELKSEKSRLDYLGKMKFWRGVLYWCLLFVSMTILFKGINEIGNGNYGVWVLAIFIGGYSSFVMLKKSFNFFVARHEIPVCVGKISVYEQIMKFGDVFARGDINKRDHNYPTACVLDHLVRRGVLRPEDDLVSLSKDKLELVEREIDVELKEITRGFSRFSGGIGLLGGLLALYAFIAFGLSLVGIIGYVVGMTMLFVLPKKSVYSSNEYAKLRTRKNITKTFLENKTSSVKLYTIVKDSRTTSDDLIKYIHKFGE